MGSYQRFSDENYKNWLKAAESLYILRSNIRDFVEKETETYHSSLRETLRGLICVKGCRKVNRDGKSPLCEKCERWKEQILQSRAGKGAGVHWDNVEPHRWPTEKWEVAKVYMPRGQSGHRCFEEFDIAAILNFMAHCKHFKKFHQGQLMTKVITLRNTVMHSPEFRLNKEKMNSGRNNVLLLAKLLETCIPKLHETISEEIKQFDTVLENYPGQASQVDVKKENLKLLDREQQALKEKIEFLAQRYEADQQIEIKDELQGMKNFLDQNKDLLESLKPQVNRLNEIQETVEKHEFQIDNLNNRVENLEKVTHDPMFTDDPLKFKNHLIEQARKRKWPEPLFTEELEASGYRGRVVVNERTFTGLQVCNNKRRAHQEVAKIALENLKSEFENTEEASTCASLISSTSSTSNLFYGTVTVVLSKEVCFDGFVKEDEAVESSYTKLARQFGLNVPGTDNTFRTAVLEHLAKHGIQPPLEITSQQDDKNVCKLHFTFYDKDGSTTKRKAEQQAAKVALQQLSGFFNCSSDDVPDENYKGFLKERLDALGMANPVYETEQKKPPEDARTSSTSRHAEHISVTQTQKHGKEKDSVAVVQPPPTKPSDCTIGPTTETRDSNPSLISREVDLEDHTEIKFLLALYHLKPPSVTVVRVCTNQNFSLTMNINLEKFTFKNSNVYTSKKDAIRKTYYLLGRALRVFRQDTDESKATMLVKQDFSQKSLTHPKEDIKGDKNFCCSLTEITYSLVCNGQGSSEAEAKQDALQKALCTLPLLFGHEALPASSSTEETEFQINTLLRNACQKDLTFSLKPNQHKISVDLQFKDFIMASKSQRTKKENRNLLSKRILGLLGEETESDCPSLRNCLDDWFKQRNLQQPVFEEMDEAQGSKATFSVELSCRHPDWEDSLEKAKENLVQELEKRFKYLIDQSKQD